VIPLRRLLPLLLAVAPVVRAAGPADPAPLAALVAAAERSAPEIAAARAAVIVAERRVDAASPTVEGAVGGAMLDDPPEAPQSRPMEELRLRAARDNVRLRVAETRAQVRLAWADAWLAHQELRLNLRDLQLSAELESVTQSGVQSGTASPARVLTARAESLKGSEARMELLEQVTSAREELIRLCGADAAAAATNFPDTLEFAVDIDRAAAVELVLRESPARRLGELAAEAARLDAAEAAARNDPLRAAARAAVAVRESELEALTRALTADAARAVVRLNTYRHHLALFREHLLPQRARITEAVRGEFGGGHMALEMALREARMELDDQMENLHHQAEVLRLVAALDRLAGGAWIAPPPAVP
jgi:hypothetical protein